MEAKRQGAELAVAPELGVPGYPPLDLLERKTFVDACRREEERIVREMPDGLVAITEDGSIYVDGQLSGQLAIDVFEDPDLELERDLPNTFVAAGPPTGTEVGRVQQFYLEMANVNPALLMTQMVDVARAYEAAQQMVQVQDELLGRTISTLGRF